MKRVLVLCLSVLSMACTSLRSSSQAVLLPSITTVAGTGTSCSSAGATCGDGGLATAANLGGPFGVAVDAAGNIYIADLDGNRIRKVDTLGKITTVTGNGVLCSSPTASCGDGGLGTNANLNGPRVVAVDPLGNVYIADRGDNRLRKLTVSTGLITTVAGTGTYCPPSTAACGDGGLATSANLSPDGVAVDNAGNIYIADGAGFRIRKIVIATGVITTVAGNGTECSSQTAPCGDTGLAMNANLYSPIGVAVDAAGNIYIADSGINRVRKVATTGIITTVAGTGTYCAPTGVTCGDGGAATDANLYYPLSMTVDSVGNLYIADELTNRIRRVAADTGIITTFAGNGIPCSTSTCGDNGPPTSANLGEPASVAIDANGDLYIADYNNNRIRKVTIPGTSTAGRVNFLPTTVGASSVTQNLLIQLSATETVSSISVPVSQGGHQEYSIGTITGCTLGASNPSGTTCTIPVTFTPAYPGQRWVPLQVVTSAGNINFGLQGTGIGPQAAMMPGIITTVAGTGNPGHFGDAGPATSAELNYPFGIAIDAAGDFYISDAYYENVILKVTAATGLMTTVAGNGTQGYSGDSGPATSASMGYPEGIALDALGNLYISDLLNGRIRKVTAATGTITTVAGSGNVTYSGDNGPATSAGLGPQGVAVDASGNLYIADAGNHRIRKVTAATGIITTVAGNGVAGDSGDNGPAASAEFSDSIGVALDSSGNLYIADAGANRIRKVTAATGIITTAAGNGTQGESGDNGPAINAEVFTPYGIVLDSANNLYIVETSGRIRKVAAATGIITTVAGNGIEGDVGDNGPATNAGLGSPSSVALDAAGNLYVVELYGQRVRKITSATSALNFAATAVGSTSVDSPQTVTLSNIGNADLIAPAASTGTNASLSANFGFGNSTTCPAGSSGGTLSSGADCLYSISFTPTAPGTISGSLVLTDNVFASPQQTISLNNGSAPGKSIPVLTVSTSASSITTAQPLTVTIGASGGGGNPAVTGSVTLTSGGYTSAATVLNGGSATINIPAGSLPVGSDTLTASYTPDSASSSTYNSTTGSNVVTVTGVVLPTITFTVANHTFGDAPFAVSVTSNSAGAITYSVVSGPATNNGPTVTLTGAGQVTLQASQAAAGNYAAGTKTATFNAGTAAQTITFTAPASPVTYGTPTIALSVSASSGLAVKFSVLSGPGTLSGNSLTITGAGTVVVAADQAGNTNYTAATEVTRSIVVNKAAPANVTLTASPNPVLLQHLVTLSATVSSPIGTPSGSVAFFDGATMLSTVALSSGAASMTTSILATGIHAITAQYLGDNNFTTFTSAAASESIQDFTLTPGSGSTTQTVSPGGIATYAFPLTLAAGTTLPTPITFTATGLPAGATATFNPASLAAGSGSTTVTLTITLPKTAQLEKPRYPGKGLPVVALSIMLLPFSRRKLRASKLSKTTRGSLALLILFGITSLLTGCGASSAVNSGGGPQSATYNITVTATSGALSHASTVVLIVQ